MYYLLSDIANIILLKNGLLTLYAAGVYCNKNNKGMVFWGAPNTGKTLTAMRLCKDYDFSLLGEDIVMALISSREKPSILKVKICCNFVKSSSV